MRTSMCEKLSLFKVTITLKPTVSCLVVYLRVLASG